MDTVIRHFTGRFFRNIYDNGDYKICAFEVDKNTYPEIIPSKYGNITLKGSMPDLDWGIEYDIYANEVNDRYGTSYVVMSIFEKRPHIGDDAVSFLTKVCTINQASKLLSAYPNIIDRISEDSKFEIDYSKVKGIGEAKYRKIRNFISDNVIIIDLIAEFCGMISFNIMQKLFDKYGSATKVRNLIRTDPYECMCSLSGVGFKTADETILQMQAQGYDFGYDIKTSSQRCIAFINYRISEEENNGDTVIDILSLKREVDSTIPECSDRFFESVKSDRFKLIKEYQGLSNKATYDAEDYVAEKLISLLKANYEPFQYDIESYRELDGFSLTDEQLKILDLVSNNGVSLLIGQAGVGKTASVKALLNLLDDLEVSYLLMAPTGKAAKVMSFSTNKQAYTIHRALGWTPFGWTYNENYPLNVDVIIVDETSMIDIRLFKTVLQAIDESQNRVLFIGDSGQLPSVSCGNVLYDMLNSNIIPTHELTKVFRYAEGGLMAVATDVRNCKQYLPNELSSPITPFGNNNDYIFVTSSNEQTPVNTMAIYKQLLEHHSPEEVQIITGYRKGNHGSIELNKLAQPIANKDLEHKPSLTVGKKTFYLDDIVLQTKNNYRSKQYDGFSDDEKSLDNVLIPNGETGKIIKILEDESLVINFGEYTVKYTKGDLSSIELGYAITTHKSQGSSIPYVVLATPASQMYMLNSNLLYVGMTRASKKCFHISEKRVVNIALQRKEDMKRKTMLQYLLKAHWSENTN